MISGLARVWIPASLSLSILLGGACAGIKTQGGGGGSSAMTGGGGSSGKAGGGGSTLPPANRDCRNLECQQTRCIARSCTQAACGENQNPTTTLTGVVYDPAGRTPLYNIAVYVPNAALDPIPDPLSCGTCDGTASGQPIASALTDATGKFVLDNPPVGTNIPLVLQVGKWRRQVTIPSIGACQDNVVDDPDHNLLRLPRDQSEGHIPQIALSTGHSDALDCLLRKIGIADSEFTVDSGPGRVHMYVGGGGVIASDHGEGANHFASGQMFSDAYKTLLTSFTNLSRYDIVILQCEGQSPDVKMWPFQGNLRQYADNGGRLFAEHVHATWIREGLPPWPATANWIGSGPDLPSPAMGTVDTSFFKGQALSDWLMATGATQTPGQISLIMGQNSVDALNVPTQRWIYTASPATTQYLTFNTPLESSVAHQCGRVVFTDVHVASGDSSHPEVAFPGGCTASPDTTPQEKALEFMFFDLSSCVQIDTAKPIPIPIVP
jgi:hypothetical protein